MKKLLLLLTFVSSLTSLNLWAQTIESEQAMNALLRENARKAAEQKAKLEGNKPKSVINNLSGNSNAANLNLTDQDKQYSEEYINHSKANRIMEKNCSGEMASVCSGGEGKHKFMGMDPNMMKAVASAYATIGGMALNLNAGPGSVKKTDAVETKDPKTPEAPKDPKADTAAAKDGKKEKAEDNCKYIPMATEMVATFTQQNLSKELQGETNSGSAQRDGLLKAAKSHDGRAKMAQTQAMGWFGGGACYAILAATGTFAVDTKLVIKLGASVLLGSFYQSEVAANKDYADKMRKIAAQMPGKGDCNPITDKLCYCAQPETENDPQYCKLGLHNKKIAMDSFRIACTDDNMKIDPNCNCESRNACFDSFIAARTQGALDFGSASTQSPFKSIRSFARGELVGGTLNSNAYNQTAAIAKKALNELGSRFPSSGPLSPAQKAMADAFLKHGIPTNAANLMAQNPPPQSAIDSAMGKISGSGSGLVAMVAPRSGNSNILDFSGGNGLGTRGTLPKNNDDDFASKLKLGGKNATNSKIMLFAQRAEALAAKSGQISRGDDRPIFEIISMRYQLTGRKRLEIEAEGE